MGLIVRVGISRRLRGCRAAADRQRQRRLAAGQAGASPRSTRPWPLRARKRASRSSICARASSSAAFPGSIASLSKLELGPQLQTLLYQADLKWTAGGLLAMCAACFAVPAYLVYLTFRHHSHRAAGRTGGRHRCPSALCCSSAASASTSFRRGCRRRWI